MQFEDTFVIHFLNTTTGFVAASRLILIDTTKKRKTAEDTFVRVEYAGPGDTLRETEAAWAAAVSPFLKAYKELAPQHLTAD